MTTPRQPRPNTGKTLEPSSFAVKKFSPKRVYPDGAVDDFGQVRDADKDRSQLGRTPAETDTAHYRSDIDSSQQALHHTLGPGRNQAAPGNHQHDGTTSPKIGPLEMDPTPGNEGLTRPELTVAATAASIRTFLHEFFNFRDI